MNKRYILIGTGIVVILLLGIIILNINRINETLQKVILKKEKLEDNLDMKVNINELQGKNALITLVFENPLGISEITYPNEEIVLNGYGREKIAIDYSINKEDTYAFNIVSSRRDERTSRNKL